MLQLVGGCYWKRQKYFAAANIVQERRSHGYHSIDHSNSAVNGGGAGLALGRGLGLWAERRTRIDSFDFNNSRLDGTPVKGGPFGLTPPLQQFGRAFVQRPRLPRSRLMIRMTTAITSR